MMAKTAPPRLLYAEVVSMLIYTLGHKKRGSKLFATTLANID